MNKIIDFVKKLDFFKISLRFLTFVSVISVFANENSDGGKIASGIVLSTCLILFYKLRNEER